VGDRRGVQTALGHSRIEGLRRAKTIPKEQDQTMLSRYFSVDFDGKEACQEETSCPSRWLNPGLSMMEKKSKKLEDVEVGSRKGHLLV